MKRICIALICFITLVTFTSCEKVIDLDLDSVPKKIVIEGIITDQPGGTTVLISQTKDFTENNQFIGIASATVSITEEGSSPITLIPSAAGVYSGLLFKGTPGKSYKLNVTVNNQQFSATCRMPLKTNLDSVFITEELFFTDYSKITNALFKDPATRGDCYRFIQYLNGKKEDQLNILNDDYTNDRSITTKLFIFDDEDEEKKLVKGDIVKVEMQCIDPVMYKYWFSLLRSSTGGSQQATPSNPVSNMQGGALGYFSAHTSQERTVIVP